MQCLFNQVKTSHNACGRTNVAAFFFFLIMSAYFTFFHVDVAIKRAFEIPFLPIPVTQMPSTATVGKLEIGPI